MNEELKKRLKAFGWAVGMMIVAAGVDFALQNLGLFNLSGSQTVVLGLLLAQLSKAIHNSRQENLTQ